MTLPLMPKATAVWLVDNTTLTFDQIAEFCGLHVLEVKGIADGEVAQGIVGLDPVGNGQLTKAEIERCEGDAQQRLQILKSAVPLAETSGKGSRYTPVSKRGDRPDAIAWLLKFHPEITDAQIQRLLGTTKSTIEAVRDRSHWNAPNIRPHDPVSLGICSQLELDRAVQQAQKRKINREKREAREARKLARLSDQPNDGQSVQPNAAAEQEAPEAEAPASPPVATIVAPTAPKAAEPTADSVFANFPRHPTEGEPGAD